MGLLEALLNYGKNPKGVVDLLRTAPPSAFDEPKIIEQAAKLWKELGVESPFFKNWFQDSKIVNSAGKPKVVYHGTTSEKPFDIFNPVKSRRSGFMGKIEEVESPASFFSESPYMARAFGQNRAEGLNDSRLIKAYLKSENPLDLNIVRRDALKLLKPIGVTDIPSKSGMWQILDRAKDVNAIKQAGYDSALLSEKAAANNFGTNVIGENVFKHPEAEKTIAVFNPNQIKSATNNRGTFSPYDPSVFRAIIAGIGNRFNGPQLPNNYEGFDIRKGKVVSPEEAQLEDLITQAIKLNTQNRQQSLADALIRR